MGVYLQDSFDPISQTLRVGRTTPFGEMGVYQLTNVFNLQSTWGPSDLNDIQTTNGTGSIDYEQGTIKLTTGSTTTSDAELKTLRRGEYVAGKSAEAGVGFKLQQTLEGDETFDIGLFDDDNGMFVRIEADDVLKIVTRREGVETVVSQSGFSVDSYDGTGPSKATFSSTKPMILELDFTWYGVGELEFAIFVPYENDSRLMQRITLHQIEPSVFPSLIDPNLPLTAKLSNGTGTRNLAVNIGGRRYDIEGEFITDARNTGDYNTGVSVGTSGLTPLIAFQRKTDWPAGSGKENSVNAFLQEFDVSTDQDIVLWVFQGGTLTGGSFGGMTNHTATETCMESNTGLTAYTAGVQDYGPLFVEGGTPQNKLSLSQQRGQRILFKQSIPLVIAGTALSSTATVSIAARLQEEW